MNVFMIIEDALRPDHLGCYGYGKNTSPNIDRIAREGVVFKNCISVASHTLPPIVSILTGLSTATHGLVNAAAYAGWRQNPAWRDRPTPLKILRDRGYLVDGELVLRWAPLGFHRDTPGDQIPSYMERHRGEKWFFLAEPYPTHLPYNPPEQYFQTYLDPGYRMEEDTRRRVQVVRNHLIVHPSGVISKLEAGQAEALPDEASDSSHKRTVGIADFHAHRDAPAVRALYDGEVRVFDDLVGGWIQALEAQGLLDDTLVLITADHGEELLERGYVGHCSCNLKGTLYDESIRVPLILRYPRILPRGEIVDRQISQIDIMPTIFDLMGIEQAGLMEGCSTLALLSSRGGGFRSETFSETPPAGWQALQEDDREIWGIRTASWKLILNTTASRKFNRYELYDLRRDPAERENRYRAGHPQARRLRPKLEAFIERARRMRG